MVGSSSSKYEELRVKNIRENREALKSIVIKSKVTRQDSPPKKRSKRKTPTSKENVPPPKRTQISRQPKKRVDNNYTVTAPEDHSLYCEDCKDYFLEGCPSHPPTITDGNDLVRVGPSRIPNSGRGVFNASVKVIPKNHLLGPYLGEFYCQADVKGKHPESGYAWELLDPDLSDAIGIVDPGPDPDPYSNWLAMVNTSPTHLQQNLSPLQFKGGIYYRASRNILPNGDDYVRTFGISSEDFFRAPNSRGGFPCVSCGLIFSVACALETHAGSCQGSYKTMKLGVTNYQFPCETCKRVFLSWRSLGLHVKRDHVLNKEFNCEVWKGLLLQV